MFIGHIGPKLVSFFRALYGRMFGEKFFKYPGSMWVGGPATFLQLRSEAKVI
jgi:hypothetical protein